MASPPLSEQQREALRDIIAEAEQRAQREEAIRLEFETKQQQIQTDFENTKEKIGRFYETVKEASRNELVEAKRRIVEDFNLVYRAAAKEYAQKKRMARNHHNNNKEKLSKEFKETRWSINTVFDSNKKTAKETRAERQNEADARFTKIKQCVEKAEDWAQLWGFVVFDKATVDATTAGGEEPFTALQECASNADEQLESLRQRTISLWMRWQFLTPAALLVWLAASVPAYFFSEWWIAVGAGAFFLVALAALGMRMLMSRKARRRTAAILTRLRSLSEQGRRLQEKCFAQTERTYTDTRRRIRKDAKRQLKEAARRVRGDLQASRDERTNKLNQIETEYLPHFESLSQRRSIDMSNAKKRYREQKNNNRTRRDTELQTAEQALRLFRQQANHRHASAWVKMARDWKIAVECFVRVAKETRAECDHSFPAWEALAEQWKPPETVPRGIRIGELLNVVEHIPHATSADMHTVSLELPFDHLPALLPFPNRASLLLKASGDGRWRAVDVLQTLLMRCATALPPGKVRFTILDPVSRGEHFAALMHLADYEPLMVADRIWTESSHIDQRLLDLTDHMENVIQKYLRNQFKTLEEYNAQAGEMAEPYRFLVAANYPVNFSAEACRRLVSLASSGARCGVYTFISVDEQQPLPHGVDLADLADTCTVMQWKEGCFVWNDADFAAFPLRLDGPPQDDWATKILHEVGRRTKEAGRVEVPFRSVAPPSERWWTGDSRHGLSIPLGKAGAIDRQYLTLGEGTSQHVLVAGKTGSGKSTLLHALIAQLALHYNPHQVQLYLIDFKKGVEFKTYAVHRLPHAAVVAVESEREFGLSVLKRLDGELKQRGELFRQAGVTDLAAFRGLGDANGEPREPTPRIVLIVDEFQEFFVEEDKIAQEASLLLDRLVRQGRAFGIHILLGSQTLGGAYSLARSTLDQMAVRIALQCSESDGHLVLSKDNAAARLLTRPGEAIYNASNGAMEGNNLFQTVWLGDHERDFVLQQVRKLAEQRAMMPRRQIVFEGTAPSDLRSNPFLQSGRTENAGGPPWRAWLGEAVAIKDPTAAVFPLQSGANLLIVGQQAEAAFQIELAAMVGLSAQIAGADSQPWMHMIVGAALEEEAGQLHEQIPDLFGVNVRACSLRELPAVLTELAAEVDRRLQTTDKHDPQFLFLHGIQRMRDLRRAEDDFGLSRRSGEQATPDRLFQHIVAEGPTVGVYTLAWCDTLPNLNRIVDRRMMREFEMRVLFQMNANDSSALIDDPSASKLGPHRALFYTEDEGNLEKFRPYGLPDVEWLRGLVQKEPPTE